MYLRKISPRTTCLYSEASMWPRNLSAAAHNFCSNPRFAPFEDFALFVRFLGHKSMKQSSLLPSSVCGQCYGSGDGRLVSWSLARAGEQSSRLTFHQ
jgi:hypothetical protein